jgi:uridine monophosphate synthetase
MTFFSRLTVRAHSADSLLCVGLDPHPDLLPEPTAEAARAFCLRLIETTADVACAFKPNSAFFEAFGAPGIECLRQVIAAVPDGIPVILDAKRGDIESSAAAYAQAAFQTLRADAVTASPYLGRDSLGPFLNDPEHGVFLLCKTSNPGSDDLQAARLEGGEELYQRVARLAVAWNTADNLGLVVAATDPAALAAVRAVAPDLWILAPGVGAQGGDLEAAVRAGLRADRLGLLLPVSRSLGRARDPHLEADRLRQAVNCIRKEHPVPASPLGAGRAALADALLEAGCVRFGEFRLKSGLISPIYLDLRRLVSDPGLLARAASAYGPLLAGLAYDRLAALPYAALPIGAVLSQQTGRPLVYPRKEAKDYGTRAEVEGDFNAGETVVVIDDVATTGGSKFEAIGRLEAAGLVVRDVVVLIDRKGGAGEALATAGYRLHAAFTLPELLDHWEATDKVESAQIASVRRLLAAQAPGREQA